MYAVVRTYSGSGAKELLDLHQESLPGERDCARLKKLHRKRGSNTRKTEKSWGEFSAKDKVGCVATAKIGGNPSYTEVLTCLEMVRDLDKIRATSSDKAGGDGTTGPRRNRRR
jgi:hypothetical protein